VKDCNSRSGAILAEVAGPQPGDVAAVKPKTEVKIDLGNQAAVNSL
jgi:hypothetical protein